MKTLIALLAMVTFTLTAFGEGTTIADLQAFLKGAEEFAKKNGKQKALDAFNDLKGQFVKGELYIFALDDKGTTIAHGQRAELRNKNMMALRDPNGVFFMEKMINIAKTSGRGCVKYIWAHPVKKTNVEKLSYIVKIDDSWFIGAGIYKDTANEKDWNQDCK